MDVKSPDPMKTGAFATPGEHCKVTDPIEDLEYQSSFVASAIRCREIGWRLAAVDARELVDLAVDFEDPAERWLQQCLEAGSLLGRVNLGVHTGSASGLVILEVGNGEGKSALDHYGSWRSPCQARMNGREQHYYTLPAGVMPPPTRYLMASRVMLFGEEGLAPLPPSLDVQSRNAWRWVNPPWEYLPPELPAGLRNFLKQLNGPSPEPETADDVPRWDEVFGRITSHEPLLNALLAPYPSLEAYYGDLLKIALASGLYDQRLLWGILWHAPQGDAQENPGRGPQLRRMVQEAGAVPGGPPVLSGLSSAGSSDQENGEQPQSKDRREVILGELQRLMQKAAELEAVVQDWQQVPAAGAASASLPSQVSLPGAPGQAPQTAVQLNCGALFTMVNEFLIKEKQKCMGEHGAGKDFEDSDPWRHHYSELQAGQEPPSPQTAEATIDDCLKNSPELVEDPEKLQMVQYCFKNYVNINPDLSDLSLAERWERASQMAREFMGVRHQG